MGYYCNTVGFFFLKTRLLYLASCIGTILLAYKHLLACLQHAFSDIIPRIQAHFMRVSRKWARVAKPNVSIEVLHDLFWNRCGKTAFSTYFWTPTCKIPNQHSQWWLEWQFNNIWKIRNPWQFKAHLDQFSSNSDYTVVYCKNCSSGAIFESLTCHKVINLHNHTDS